jgi:hypothetical protein
MNKNELKKKYMQTFSSKSDSKVAVTNDEIIIEGCSDDDYEDIDMLKSYKYLFQDVLQKDIAVYLQSRKIETYKINILGFRINDELKLPFLEFLFLENSTYELPQFEISQKDLMIKQKESTVENKFIETCYSELNSQYNHHFESPKYIGFKNVNGVFYAFVYLDDAPTGGKYILYDEIRYTKTINSKDIIQYEIFKFNNINQLLNKNGSLYDVPMIGYMCKYNDKNKLINIETSDDDFEDSIDDDEFGTYFIFSESPLAEGNYKRYAIFMSNILFYFKENPTLQRGGKNEKTAQYEQYNSIYYYTNNNVFYYVKALEQFAEI